MNSLDESFDPRETYLVSGNEAIALAAADAGIQIATGYPGTPSTQIIERLQEMPGDRRVMWHTNEKTALEMAIGAALHPEGRALVAMKHVGLNVAADAFKSVAVTGITGSVVLVVCDDPGMHSSQNEFDSRRYAVETATVVLEASDSQEAYDLTREAVRISHQIHSLVMLRMTTRVCHANSQVRRSEPAPGVTAITPLMHRPSQYVVAPAFSRPNVQRLFDSELPRRIKLAEAFAGNRISGPDHARYGIIVTGVTRHYLADVLDGDAARILALTMPFPLPVKTLREFADTVDQLIVFEEGSTLCEELLRNRIGNICDISRSYGEWTPERVRDALCDTGLVLPSLPVIPSASHDVEPAQLCPGCPHRAISFAVKQLGFPMIGDIGCSTLTAFEPLDVMSTALEMGASIPMAEGSHHLRPDSKPVCMIGDGTFLHSGIPGLLGAVENGARITVLILDNDGIAMTGQQRIASSQGRRVDLEKLVASVGVAHIETIDAHDSEQCRTSLLRAQKEAGVSVIVVRDSCILTHPRMKADGVLGPRFDVDPDRCTQCGQCLELGCPSISLSTETQKPWIDDSCVGCGDCIQVCNPCPVGTSVQQFTAMFSSNQLENGADTLYASNPFAAACGSLCEGHCQTSAIVAREGDQLGEPRVHDVPFPEIEAQLARSRSHRSAVSTPDHPRETGGEESARSDEKGERKRIAIVGAGPAGLSAARELAISDCDVTILEASQTAGGMMRQLVTGEGELEDCVADDIHRILDLANVRIRYRMPLDADHPLDELCQAYDAVLLACGLQGIEDPETRGQLASARLDLGPDGLKGGQGFQLKENIFGAGDIGDGVTRDLAHAVAFGKRAAAEIFAWLSTREMGEQPTSVTPARALLTLPRPRPFLEDCDILLGSVGGQGGVTISRILVHAFQLAGWYCKSSEVHGLAQRGGPVTLHVRGHRKRVGSPLVEQGRAGVGLFLDPEQAVHWQHWISDEGVIVLPGEPSSDSAGNASREIPADTVARMRPGLEIAEIDTGVSSGDRRRGMILLGYLSRWLPIPFEVWQQAIKTVVPVAGVSSSLDAFLSGATLE